MNPDTSLSTQIVWFALMFLFSSPLSAFVSYQAHKRMYKPTQMAALRLIRGPVIGLFCTCFVMMIVLTPTYEIFAIDDDAGRLMFWGALSLLSMIAGDIGRRLAGR